MLPRASFAQAYPNRPITLIVPFPPGGSTDVAARIAADHMSRTLGQQIVVQNVSGAGGTTGSTRAMRSDPDGYTILMGQMGTHAAAVALYPNLAYKPAEDFETIGLVTGFPIIIAAKKDFPAKDLKEFVAYVKANSGKLNQAHAGVGSIFFTTCLMLNGIIGAKPTQVPFNGGAPAMNALVGGQVDYMCADIITGGTHHESGAIKVLGIAAPEPNPALPGVPTTAQGGLPEFQVSAWNGFLAPKGTPKPVIDRLADALDKALDDEATRKRMLVLGCDIPEKSRRGPAPFLALIKSEIDRWSPIIKAAGVADELARCVWPRAQPSAPGLGSTCASRSSRCRRRRRIAIATCSGRATNIPGRRTGSTRRPRCRSTIISPCCASPASSAASWCRPGCTAPTTASSSMR